MVTDAPRIAEPPAEFDTYQLVLLVRPDVLPDHDEATIDLLHHQHLGHFADMRDAGHLVASGPLSEQPDEHWRGICIYRTGSVEEARRLAELDPAVIAGRFTLEVMTWRTPKGALTWS